MAKRKTLTPRQIEEQAHQTRCRFNSGYHDAAQSVRMGWATAERNYGFGPVLKIECPADVLAQHFSKVYAAGWMAGYEDAQKGRDTSSSEHAWQNADI